MNYVFLTSMHNAIVNVLIEANRTEGFDKLCTMILLPWMKDMRVKHDHARHKCKRKKNYKSYTSTNIQQLMLLVLFHV